MIFSSVLLILSSQEYITIDEARKILDVSADKLREMREAGELPSVKIGRAVRIKTEPVKHLYRQKEAWAKVYLTVEQACQRLRISRKKLYNLIKAGELRTEKKGYRIYIPLVSIISFENRRKEAKKHGRRK